jgi:hypothetical protein
MKIIIYLLPVLLTVGCKVRQQSHPRDHFGHTQKIILIADEYSVIKKNEHLWDQDKDDWLDPNATYETIKNWTPLDYLLSIELCDTVIILNSKKYHDVFTPNTKLGENPNWWVWEKTDNNLLDVRVTTDYDHFWIHYWDGNGEIIVYKVHRQK